MKKVLISIVFIAVGHINTAQFIRKAASATGRFVWAPSIGVATLSMISFYCMQRYLEKTIFSYEHGKGLTKEFVKEFDDFCKKKGVAHAQCYAYSKSYFLPYIDSYGNVSKSSIGFSHGWGITQKEQHIKELLCMQIDSAKIVERNSSLFNKQVARQEREKAQKNYTIMCMLFPQNKNALSF